jgi:hypothetical protein
MELKTIYEANHFTEISEMTRKGGDARADIRSVSERS